MVCAQIWNHHTQVMGILNVTPDSFSDPGLYYQTEDAVKHALEMEKEGADIIDVGGESTRPGAKPVPLKSELERVIPVIRAIREESNIPISIDTYKSEVAGQAIDSGANMVNDISALRFDDRMGTLVAEKGVSIVLMHMQGEPRNMQDNPVYDDVVEDIISFLHDAIEEAMEAGISKNNIIIDPGIGFGKTLEHNLKILKRLNELKVLGCPILLGTSRKSFIGKVTGLSIDERLPGTIASNVVGVMNGAKILRVHDVASVKQAMKTVDAITYS